ncbi:hypothetical protein PZN02_006078 (plasmid) [Sinorhizobium garamanticum]|uniref:Uncharacterized protein n=1 Tax=Sinorhizobium garamanticum TaxID=680247 RepID=A0ABY8DNP4_9HYPH|nr:hypothetical protein [Sinorhizobium garamanticum]WEX91763.1 hypothetical protein PZN02_006078 [Sinorhizobium garamanticum]
MRVQAFCSAMGFPQQLPPLTLRVEYSGYLTQSRDGSNLMCSTRHAASLQSLAAAALRAINPNRMLQHVVNVAVFGETLLVLLISRADDLVDCQRWKPRRSSSYAWSMN